MVSWRPAGIRGANMIDMTMRHQEISVPDGRDERNIIQGLNFLETEAREANLAQLAEAIRGLVVEYLSTSLQRKSNKRRR